MSRDDRSIEPYRVKLATRLPRALDRRVKLTERDKEHIRELHHGGMGIRAIAREYANKCTRRVIQYTLRPELYEKLRADFKERRKDGRYKPTNKERWAKTIREHRRYKLAALSRESA